MGGNTRRLARTVLSAGAKLGEKKAKELYVREVLAYLRLSVIYKKSTTYTKPLYSDMIRHTLLLIFRTFKRFKSSFFINLTGLSNGLACAILIYLWIND